MTIRGREDVDIAGMVLAPFVPVCCASVLSVSTHEDETRRPLPRMAMHFAVSPPRTPSDWKAPRGKWESCRIAVVASRILRNITTRAERLAVPPIDVRAAISQADDVIGARRVRAPTLLHTSRMVGVQPPVESLSAPGELRQPGLRE